MEDYAGHDSVVVGDVDCTAAGKSLCDANDVKGYPTIKWGSPDALEDYSGGRDEAALKEFAEENFKATCSPDNIDLCDDEKKAKIKELKAQGLDKLKAQIEEKQKEVDDAESAFTAGTEGLQAKYEQFQKDKETKMKEIKDSGLGLMKSVLASKKEANSEL